MKPKKQEFQIPKIDKIEKFEIPECECGNGLTGGDPFKITFADGSIKYFCDACGEAILLFLDIDKEGIPEIEI